MKQALKKLYYAGSNRYCPVCKTSSRKFIPYGAPARNDAACPICGALERHRLTMLFLEKKTDIFNNSLKNMLHVAPEPVFSSLFKNALGDSYLSADLESTKAMIQMDITNISYPDNSFDIIYCSHVLEHVPDDKKALKEFYRILKHDGWAILLVPLSDDEMTFENPNVSTPEERTKLYGQHDHLRLYGKDYSARLREAGFSLQIIQPQDFLTAQDIKHMGITEAAGDIYYCTKSSE